MVLYLQMTTQQAIAITEALPEVKLLRQAKSTLLGLLPNTEPKRVDARIKLHRACSHLDNRVATIYAGVLSSEVKP